MAEWKCSAKRNLDVDEKATWDGEAAKAAIFKWAGWPDNPDSGKASGAFLAWDSAKPSLMGSYKLPFCTVDGGSLKAVRNGINNAAARLSNTDIPDSVKESAQSVIDSYKPKEKMDDQLTTYLSEMHESPVMRIDMRAAPDDTTRSSLLSIAKKRAVDPSVLDEYPPFFFSGIASNQLWDSYETRMGLSSLQNYAEDATAGLPYLRSHNTRGDPVGAVLQGTMEGTSVREDVFMISDPETLTYIAKIRSGIVTKQSIGFYGGEWICSICGRDMQQWYTADGCPHILGLMYPQVDKKGNVKADKPEVLARATIENAHQGELSGVYSGATPKAVIDKIRDFSDAGQISQRHIDLVQVRYKLDLPAQRRVYPVVKREATMTEEEIQALRDAEKAAAARAKALDVQLAALRPVLAAVVPADRAELPVADQINWLVEERARLVPMAADGAAYRTALIEEALTEGARANGATFQREVYLDILNRAPVTAIRQMRDDFAQAADKLFPKGRQTQDPDPAPLPKVDDRIKTRNDFAFKG